MATAAILLATVAPAFAHAFVDHAMPAVGSTIRLSPPDVRVWFSSGIEPAFSSVNVKDSTGKTVDRGDGHAEGNQLAVSLPPLPAGTYTVHWRVVSTDTHVTSGDFRFSISP